MNFDYHKFGIFSLLVLSREYVCTVYKERVGMKNQLVRRKNDEKRTQAHMMVLH